MTVAKSTRRATASSRSSTRPDRRCSPPSRCSDVSAPTAGRAASRSASAWGCTPERLPSRQQDSSGLDVHKAARIAAVGHGGQVLVSEACAAIVRDRLPGGVSLRSLGNHRLKDLTRAEELCQLEAEGLSVDFPPIRSLNNPLLLHNLPVQLTSFVGRNKELQELSELANCPLVTLTGAGGCGKTRLALQVGSEVMDRHRDGVWLVELASITEDRDLASVISECLGIPASSGPGSFDALTNCLAGQEMLVILDNCEHLLDEAAVVVNAILRSCPKVHVLATSREQLGIPGEQIYRVPSMSLPDEDTESGESGARFDGIELFLDRAMRGGVTLSEEDFSVIASICRRLDGIPFAIELAAARLSSMSLQQLSDRLDQRFRLLTGGARTSVSRQQTLRALVEWSYGLLSDDEQLVLRRLSVFRSGFELDAAEALCEDVGESVDALSTLHSLVTKNLVVAEHSDHEVRYRLLETIRQFGAEELLTADGEGAAEAARSRHARYFVEFAERSKAEGVGRMLPSWLRRLDKESDNLRSAVTYLSGAPGGAREVLRLLTAAELFVRSRAMVELLPAGHAALESVGAFEGDGDDLVCCSLVSIAGVTGLLQWMVPETLPYVARCGKAALLLADRLGRIDQRREPS